MVQQRQQSRVISRATVLYATAAVSIGILILTIVSFTLLALLVASPLLLPFSPIHLATGLAIAASSAAFATASIIAITVILTFWCFVPSFGKRVTGILLWAQWVVSEGWKRGRKVFAMWGVLESVQWRVGWIGDVVSEAGRRVKDNKTLSSISLSVEKTVAGGVDGGLSILDEVGKKLEGGRGVLGLGGCLLHQVVKANGASTGVKTS